MLRRLSAVLLTLALAAPLAAAAANAPQDEPPPLPSRADVLKALAKRRDHNLADFRTYRKKGVYIHNTVRSGPLNIWRDADGHLCAAATMIEMDGRDDLVKQVADTNLYQRMLDETDGPVYDWLLTSGFTLEEIDRIQAPAVEPSYAEMHPNWRAEEDARLRKVYAETDAYLVAHRKAGLAAAADRVMEHPALAWNLVNGA